MPEIINTYNLNEIQPIDTPSLIKESSDTTKQIDILEPELADVEQVKKSISLKDIKGLIEVLDSAPTGSPTSFYGSIKMYNDTLYIFDYKSNSWKTNIPSVFPEPFRGYLEITTTGLTVVTGFGFTPRFMKFTAYPYDTHQCESFSVNSTSGPNTLYKYHDGTKLVSAIDTTDCVVLKNDGGSSTVQGGVYSFDTDGFTYNASATPFSYRVLYEAYP